MLKVEPREVYLKKQTGHERTIERGKIGSPFVVQRTIWHFESAEKCPHVRITPIDDRVYTHERWPTRVSLDAEVQRRYSFLSEINRQAGNDLHTSMRVCPPSADKNSLYCRKACTEGL